MKNVHSPLQIIFLIGLFLLPFVFWPWAAVPYELPRVWFFERWVEVLIIVGFFSIGKIQPRKAISPLLLLTFFFLLLTFLSSILGADFPKSFWGNYYRGDGLITLFHLVGLFLFLYLFWDPSWQKPTALAVFLGSFGASLLAIASLFVPGIFGLQTAQIWNGAIGGTFGQPKFLAGYLIVTLPFLYYFGGRFRFAVLIFQSIAILLTFSKGGIAGIIIFGIGLLLLKQKLIKPLIPLISLIFLTAVSGLVYFLILLSKPTTLGTTENALGFNPESRPRIFIKGFFGYLQRPLFGWGWSNFDYASSAIVWPAKYEKDVYIDKAHSTLIEILVTTGPLGLIFYIAILTSAFVAIFKSNEETAWKNTLYLSLFLYLLHSQTNVTSIAEEVIFWIILGITVCYSTPVVKLDNTVRATRNVMKLTAVILLILIFSIGTGILGWWIGKNGGITKSKELVSPLLRQSFGDRRGELPLDKYSYENLSKRKFEPSEIKIENKLKENPLFTSYFFSYKSDNKKVTGQVNIPKGTPPFPTVLMIRGYTDPKEYKTGDGTKNAAAVFAKNGFLTIAPDFLGYGGSDQNAGDILESRFQTYTTVLSLLASLQLFKEADTNKLLIWAHSNGGHIALATLEITGRNIPTTLWAPVSKYFPYSVLAFTDDSEDKGKLIRRTIYEFEQNYDPNNYSVDTYFDQIVSPIQLHQGGMDESVPKRWSDQLSKTLKNKGKNITYFVYPRANHNMVPSWNIAVQRDLEFFKKYLK